MASDQLKLQEKKQKKQQKVKLMHVLVHVSPLLLLGLMALDHHGLVATSRHPAGIQTQRIRVSNSKQNSVSEFTVSPH